MGKKPQSRGLEYPSYSEGGLPLSLGLPEVVSPELGRLGPAFGYGVGCGVGAGLGFVGGLGLGLVPGASSGLFLGVGAGCGLGIGYGYGFGRGRAYDGYGDHSNVGKSSWRPGNRRGRGGPPWLADFNKSPLGRTGLGRMGADVLLELQAAWKDLFG